MNQHPPGLVNRYVYSKRDRTVVIEETWNLNVSGCPMIQLRMPWDKPTAPWPFWVRRVAMTQDEFRRSDVQPLLG